jgi:tryptophanase
MTAIHSQYFVTENGQVHTFYRDSQTSTTGKDISTTGGPIISFKDGSHYELYNSVKAAMISVEGLFDEKYAFVDEDGVIHSLNKDLSKSTYGTESHHMKIRVEKVKRVNGLDFEMFSLVDPDGEYPDDAGFVIWEPYLLAKELDA